MCVFVACLNRNKFSLNWHCALLANSWSARKFVTKEKEAEGWFLPPNSIWHRKAHYEGNSYSGKCLLQPLYGLHRHDTDQMTKVISINTIFKVLKHRDQKSHWEYLLGRWGALAYQRHLWLILSDITKCWTQRKQCVGGCGSWFLCLCFCLSMGPARRCVGVVVMVWEVCVRGKGLGERLSTVRGEVQVAGGSQSRTI